MFSCIKSYHKLASCRTTNVSIVFTLFLLASYLDPMTLKDLEQTFSVTETPYEFLSVDGFINAVSAVIF